MKIKRTRENPKLILHTKPKQQKSAWFHCLLWHSVLILCFLCRKTYFKNEGSALTWEAISGF